MTELESAQLIYMQSERITSIYALAQSQGDAIANSASLFVTLLFSYLIAAYFIGASLTRVQVIILNFLYTLSVSGLVLQIVLMFRGVRILLDKMRELTENSPQALSLENTSTITFTVTLLIAMVVASLYFMWTVRHPKTE